MENEAKADGRSGRRDLTAGPIGQLIFRLALPGTVETAIFSISGLFHAYWMGKIGGAALAAVAMGTTLRIVLISPMMGLSMGGMAVVARYIGAGETRRADRALAQAILLVVIIVIPLAILGLIMMRTFLGWMGSEGEVLTGAMAYLRIIFGGLLFMEMLPSMNGVIRGAGHPEYTLRTNLVNIGVLALVEPVLVLGLGPFPAIGVRGAGWASVLGSFCGVVAQATVLWSGRAGLRPRLRDFRPDVSLMRSILRVALPTSAQRLSPNLGSALMMRLVSAQGTEALTAYSVASRVFGMLQGPTMGIRTAAATMVGQNLGAKLPERSERSAWIAARAAAVAGLILFAAVNLVPATVIGLFSREPGVAGIGTVYLRYALLSGTFAAWSQVMGSALSGAADAITPMLANTGALWFVQLPVSWLLATRLGLGPPGIWIGLAASHLSAAIALTLRFRKGHWKFTKL